MSSSSDDPHAELILAVRAGDAQRVERSGRACKLRGDLERPVPNWAHRGCALRGPPHILAAYRGDMALLEELIPHLSDDQLNDHSQGWCRGCGVGPTALQLACSRRAVACVRVLLRLGASASASYCFEVDRGDEPPDKHHCLTKLCGLSTYSAHQIAASRVPPSPCAALLLEHGASASAHPDSECPVCYELLDDGAEPCQTTACGHTYHARCLPPSIFVCPMCRSPLTDRCASGKPAPPSQPEVASPSEEEVVTRARRWSEPGWITSPALAPTPERFYTELERRRM